MSIFDESAVEAGHLGLASEISGSLEALNASVDLIRKVLLAEDQIRTEGSQKQRYLNASVLGFRVANSAGAASKLLDCGYFVQAAGLLRDVSEIGMLMLLFSERPDELDIWSQADGDRHKKFGRSELKKKISNVERFNFFNEYFNTYSEFGTHPSAASMAAQFDGINLHIGPHVNRQIYILLHRDLSVVVWQAVSACGSAYEAVFGGIAYGSFEAEIVRYQNAWGQITVIG